MAELSSTRIGFIGLGIMGSGVVERLLKKGWGVTGFNRTASKAEKLVPLGLQVAASPREVARRCDVIFIMVTDSTACKAVFDDEQGILSCDNVERQTERETETETVNQHLRGKLIVDMSTISPEASASIAERVRERGGDMVDCPISGSHISLMESKASTMVGGRIEAFNFLRPILLDIGPKTTYVGENGKALSLKIAVNLNLAVQMMAFSESVLIAEKAGIDREVIVDVMTHSAVASPMIQYRGPLILGLPEEAWFSSTMMQKDLQLAIDMGRKYGVPLPTTSITNEFLTAGRGMGYGQEDFATLFHVL